MKFNPFKKDPQKNELDMRGKELNQQKDMSLNQLATEPVTAGEDPLGTQAKAELTRWQQTPQVEEMTMSLRRYELTKKNSWMPQLDADGEPLGPLCNELCVTELVAMLRGADKSMMMSKYEKEFILSKLRDLSNTVTLLLAHNRRRFGILMCDLTPIVRIFQHSVEPIYFRALGANEKNYLGSIHRYIHQESDRPQHDEKKKMFSTF